MRIRFGLTLAALAVLGAPWQVSAADEKKAEKAAGPRLAHMVFFTLKDRSPEGREKFVKVCNKYLSNHAGTVFFAVGTIAEDVVEPVSVRDFDVALHLVFESKEAEGRYLTDPRHTQFVQENKDAWSKVRVFDSYLGAP